MQATAGRYRRTAAEDLARIVVSMPRDEARAIDAWAIPAGQSSRSAAIRLLLRKGLEVLTTNSADSVA